MAVQAVDDEIDWAHGQVWDTAKEGECFLVVLQNHNTEKKNILVHVIPLQTVHWDTTGIESANTCGTFNSCSKEWNYHPFQKDVGASHHLAFNPEGYTIELNLYIKYSLMYYVGTYKHPIKENVKS